MTSPAESLRDFLAGLVQGRSAPIELDGRPVRAVHTTTRHPADLQPGFSVKLGSGRVIKLQEVHQSRTYAGLLEGIETDIDQDIADAVAAAPRQFAQHCARPPLVVPPVVLTGRYAVPRPMRSDEFLTWTFLPAVTTSAWFDSDPVGNDGASSSLVLVWFQMHWGLPTDPELLDAIAAVDWNANAWDWDY